MTTEELNAIIAKAEAGDVSAMNQVAQVFTNNADFKDYEKAFFWYKKSAELGNVNSMANMGWCYLYGNGVEKNLLLSIEWFEKTAAHGDTWSMNMMANWIYSEDNECKDFEKAFYWHKKASELGNVNSMANLGSYYLQGKGVEKDVEKAILWLTRAAEEGNNIFSMNKLTYIYGELEGYTNNEQAAKWFLELIKRDCDPNSGVYENTGYNKDLYAKVKNAVLSSTTEGEMMSSLTGSSSGGSLLGGAVFLASSEAKSYINQAEEALQYKLNAKEAAHKAEIEKEENELRVYLLKEGGRDEISSWFYKYRKKELIIPNGITSIKSSAFTYENITSVSFPSSVKHIGERAFWNCEQLESITFADGVEVIEEEAFLSCKSLKSIFLPKSVKTIGPGAFRGCSELVSVIVSDENENFCSVNNVIYSKDKTKLIFVPNSIRGEFEILDGVKTIGEYAFGDCEYLTYIAIPNTVTNIANHAFDWCKRISTIIIPNSVMRIGSWAIHYCDCLTSVVIPEGVLSIGQMAIKGCPNITSITLPDSLVNIGDDAVCDCNRLKKIIVPEGKYQKFRQMEGLSRYKSLIVEE